MSPSPRLPVRPPAHSPQGRQTAALLPPPLHLQLEQNTSPRNERLHVDVALFRIFYEDNPSMFFVVDEQGSIRSCNRFGAECLGYQQVELIGLPVAQLFHQDDRLAATRALADAFAAPQAIHQWDLRKRTKTGTIMWVHETTRVVREPTGESLALIVCQDTTAQTRADGLIREQEQAVRSLQQATAAVGVPFDQQLRTVLELGCRRFRLPIGVIARRDGDIMEVEHVWPPDCPFPAGLRVPLKGSFCQLTLAAEGALCLLDVNCLPPQTQRAFRDSPFRSYFGIKLAGISKTYGTLAFLGTTPYPEPFTEAQTDFLLLVAQWIGHELDRRAAEQALRESRELFEVAFQASPNPAIVTELETGRCVEVNDVALTLFGFTREEAIGQTTVEMGLWLNQDARADFLWRLATDGPLRNVEMVFRNKIGQDLRCRLSCEPIMLNGVRCLLTVAQDIREQKRAEAALRASEDRFRRLFEDAPVGMCILGSDLTIRKTNLAFQQLTGYSDLESFGRPGDFYIHTDDVGETRALGQQFHAGEVPGYAYEKRSLRKNGVLMWVHVTVSPLVFPGVEERQAVAIVQDVTARTLAEQALAQRERDLRQALDDREQVSQDLHDGILQALYAVGLSLDTTGRLVGPSPRRAKQALSGAISQLNRTIQEIRSFIATLSLDLPDAAHVTQVLRTVVGAFCTRGRTRCDIAISPKAGRQLLRAQCVHLVNIVREAVSNSVRHGAATRIRVTLRPLKGRLQLTIVDNGAGFDSDAAMKRGYGLRNMRSRATKIGGTLKIVSAPDRGTRITVPFVVEESRELS